VAPAGNGDPRPVEQPNKAAPMATPPVRKFAKDLGVDLRSVHASRGDGVITREDVEHEAAARTTTTVAPTGADRGPREHRIPVAGVRKATAAAMVASAFTAPHVTEFLTVDVTPMMELRDRLRARREFADANPTPLALVARAVCLAARRTPEINAVYETVVDGPDQILVKDYLHLGIAAATDRGLIVPVIHDADAMNLADLAGALQDLTATARAGHTTVAQLTGGTFTITNVGVFGIDTGTPIINPGQSAILAVGAIRDAPWVVDGRLAVRKVCQLALSFDHRVIDGQQGSQFLADVGAVLADPGLALAF
jgi:pyruvate dehydrogenase E2 component (dihydrolipoamide acetyltransferase)